MMNIKMTGGIIQSYSAKAEKQDNAGAAWAAFNSRESILSGLENVFKLIGRLAIAAIFLFAAFGKVMNPSGTISHIGSAGIPVPGLAYALTVALEAVGGALIVIGWKTKYAALALCLFLIPATYFFHYDPGDRVQTLMALKNLAIMGGLLLLAASGPGRISFGRD